MRNLEELIDEWHALRDKYNLCNRTLEGCRGAEHWSSPARCCEHCYNNNTGYLTNAGCRIKCLGCAMFFCTDALRHGREQAGFEEEIAQLRADSQGFDSRCYIESI